MPTAKTHDRKEPDLSLLVGMSAHFYSSLGEGPAPGIDVRRYRPWRRHEPLSLFDAVSLELKNSNALSDLRDQLAHAANDHLGRAPGSVWLSLTFFRTNRLPLRVRLQPSEPSTLQAKAAACCLVRNNTPDVVAEVWLNQVLATLVVAQPAIDEMAQLFSEGALALSRIPDTPNIVRQASELLSADTKILHLRPPAADDRPLSLRVAETFSAHYSERALRVASLWPDVLWGECQTATPPYRLGTVWEVGRGIMGCNCRYCLEQEKRHNLIANRLVDEARSKLQAATTIRTDSNLDPKGETPTLSSTQGLTDAECDQVAQALLCLPEHVRKEIVGSLRPTEDQVRVQCRLEQLRDGFAGPDGR